MNKYQEALNQIKHELYAEEDDYNVSLMQELVDKATPTTCSISFGGVYCDNCNYRVGDNNGWTQATVRYCQHCGLALLWKD